MKDNNYTKPKQANDASQPADGAVAPASYDGATVDGENENLPLSDVLKIPAIVPDRGAIQRLILSTESLYTYSHRNVELFCKSQKQPGGLGNNIRQWAERTMRLALLIQSYNPTLDREKMLREMSIDLKMIEVNIKAAFKMNIINESQCKDWFKEVYRLDDMAIGLAMGFQKKKRAARSPKKMKK